MAGRIDPEILRRNELLSQLEDDEMAELLDLARIESFNQHRVIFQKHDPGDCLYAVIAGRVGISTESEAGKSILLNIMEAGAVFGEIALLDGKERTANATALVNSELLRIDRAQFLPFLERHPGLAVRLMAVLCQRIRWTSDIIEDTIFLDVPHRLAKRLVTLAAQYGKPVDGAVRIDIRLSQESLGQMLGASRESVNKSLRSLEQKGLIELEGGYMRIADVAALEAFAERGEG